MTWTLWGKVAPIATMMAGALFVDDVPTSQALPTNHEVKITSGPPPTTTSTSATFEFSAPALYGARDCSLDNGPFDGCLSPKLYEGLSVGPHVFVVRAKQSRLGTTDSDSRTWTIVEPTPAPETTITGGPPGATNETSATLTFTATIPGATFKCRLDGGLYAACTSPAPYPGLGPGSHTFEVFASAGGLDDPTPASRTWIVDTTAPTASMVLPNTTFTLEKTFLVSWTGSDAQTNVASFDLSYRQAHWNGDFNGRPPLWLDDTTDADSNFTGKPGWTYCFKVRATDLAGNLGGFSPERCTALPVHAATLNVQKGTWYGILSQGSYLNAYKRPKSITPTPGGSLTDFVPCVFGLCGPDRAPYVLSFSARPVRAALVVTKCQGCGRFYYFGVDGGLGKTNMRFIDTNKPGVTKKALVPVPVKAGLKAIGASRGIAIAVWDGRPRIEGVGISRAPILRAG